MKIFLALFLLFQQLVFAQSKEVEATLSIDKSYSFLSDPIRVVFEINQTSTIFDPPSFKGFMVLSGPNTTYSSSFDTDPISKKPFATHLSKIVYILKPLNIGELSIDEGRFTVNGKFYKTPIKSIDIVENSKASDVSNKSKIIILCEISNTKPFRNQSTTVTYHVYYDKELKNPSGVRLVFDNEYNKDFLIGSASHIYEGISLQKFNGVEYKSFVIQTDFLRFKELYDTYIRGMLELDYDQTLYTVGEDTFKKTTTKRIPFESERIITKNLPPEFNHFRAYAVGQFSFDTIQSNTTAKLNSEYNIELVVKGKGFLENDPKMIPTLALPPQLHLVKTEVINDLYYDDSIMSSVNTIKYTIMPLEKGIFAIKKPSLRFFDDSSNSYQETFANDFVITVN